ncbi:MAG TPA: excisionase family DNA-binding protein [bacterium]|jgi:excisionase family DNA binding protein|nr:excisionase family DNA-binding protein [Myxococcales bacterium]HPW45261.1 excisionase family DNA-binding protein [bacterium]HQC51334.1 excisionase family DNA-binding protein [bacterium]HQG13952.1 excisionase family DNA-binding protein [bacterium]HQH80742.1 excisionase family DNA-binding protein [bacterium]
MVRKDILTTFEAASLCSVSYNTIKNWIKRNMLSAYRTAGGHLRIKSSDLESFSREYGIPIADKDGGNKRRVLILDNGNFTRLFSDSLNRYSDKIDLYSTKDPFEAGSLVESRKPDIFIINSQLPGVDAARICSHVKKRSALKHAKIGVIGIRSAPDSLSDVGASCAADFFFKEPIDKVEIYESIEPMILPKKGVRSHRNKRDA